MLRLKSPVAESLEKSISSCLSNPKNSSGSMFNAFTKPNSVSTSMLETPDSNSSSFASGTSRSDASSESAVCL